MNRLMKDLSVDRARNPETAARDKWDPEDEGGDEDDEELEANIVDRSASIHHPQCASARTEANM